MYRFVFTHALARVFVVVLLSSLFLQTIERAFASELVAPPEEASSLITITDEMVSTIETEYEARTDHEPENDATVHVNSDVPLVETGALPTPEGEVSGSVSTAIGTTDTEATTTSLLQDVTTTDLDAIDVEVVSSSTATTTDVSIPMLTVESDAMIQFNKDNCLAVEDGSFYCQVASTTPTVERGLFALPDSDGDLEIYIKNGDEMKQITFNTIDDASPYYDPASDSIVWHRMIDERYQIVVYDVASGEEVQLTDTSTNNMEPFRADNMIVWQHWDNDAWQIMLFDGSEIQQLTATVEHNLAPVIRNNLVVWHRVMYGEKTIEVYDIKAKSYMTIRDTEGGTISNPRMVLVYDAAMDNGEVVTRGYDLVTGEITSFASEPTPLPDEIPEPEATGETRALLTTKSEQQDGDVSDDSDSGLDTGNEPQVATGTISVATDLTLDLSSTTPTATAAEVLPVAIPDLVVPPFDSNASPDVLPVVE